MGEITGIWWLVLGVVAGFGVLNMLRALAIGVRNETMIHDLKVGVARIQVQQFHSEMLRHGIVPSSDEGLGGVEILDSVEPAAAPANGQPAPDANASNAETADESATKQAA